eukprot:m.207919 g.207919  ORF g.207919 m.207919 type:complete len:156 (+) comp16921_c4_seq1:91-558(+)
MSGEQVLHCLFELRAPVHILSTLGFVLFLIGSETCHCFHFSQHMSKPFCLKVIPHPTYPMMVVVNVVSDQHRTHYPSLASYLATFWYKKCKTFVFRRLSSQTSHVHFGVSVVVYSCQSNKTRKIPKIHHLSLWFMRARLGIAFSYGFFSFFFFVG